MLQVGLVALHSSIDGPRHKESPSLKISGNSTFIFRLIFWEVIPHLILELRAGCLFEIRILTTPYRASTPSPTPAKPRRLRKLLPIPTHENIYTLPNLLTFSRLLSAPLIGYFILHEQHLAAVSLFAYAGFTDLIDGWIARRYHSTTVVGTVIDPMADKTLMTVLTVCLAINGGLPSMLSFPILQKSRSEGLTRGI
jgi:hypothetical protein